MSESVYSYDFLNIYNARRTPGTVHCHNTVMAAYFRRYLFQKMISTVELTCPEEWPKDYFLYVLYAMGYISVLDVYPFGVIPQYCTIQGRNIYYQPNKLIVTNPAFPAGQNSTQRRIGIDAALLKLTPDYRGTTDIIDTYADLMALTLEAAGINIINSKSAFIFGAQNKRQAESYKKMLDQVNEGNPAAYVDKELFNEEGELNVTTIQQDLRNMYIAPDLVNTLKQIECMFDAEIGLPNNPTEKKERLITDEVNANNASTYSKLNLWLDTFNESAKEVKRLYGLEISLRAREMILPEGNTQEAENESDTID